MIIRPLLLATALLVSTCTPAFAKKDPGAQQLLKTVSEHVTVHVNPKRCDTGKFYGSYHWKQQVLTLCVQSPATPNDYDTLRHEVWHIVQSCLTPANSKLLYPVMDVDQKEWHTHVLSSISASVLTQIQEDYPKTHWDAEIEAYSTAKTFTSAQIEKFFKDACLSSP
jgi:hypothetical protein